MTRAARLEGFTVLIILARLCRGLPSHDLALQLPPSIRRSIGQTDDLRQDCKAVSGEAGFVWDSTSTTCNYQLAASVFQSIFESTSAIEQNQDQPKQQRHDHHQNVIHLWFPQLDDATQLRVVGQVLQSNRDTLGLSGVKIDAWPNVPATKLELSFAVMDENETSDASSSPQSITQSIQATETWVEEKLCKLGLCPYTASLQRAAIGLESVGVQEGPIIVHHAFDVATNSDIDNKESEQQSDSDAPPSIQSKRAAAACLAHAFWQNIVEIATVPETKVATTLLVAPPYYDSRFADFCHVFDSLLEPSIQATNAHSEVGRAIFHPHYDSSKVLHSANTGKKDDAVILPGHALPTSMVQGFVDKYYTNNSRNQNDSNAGTEKIVVEDVPSLDEIAKANDGVRWTPHATINLLRRPQLDGAKEAEAASASKRPNYIYARNVFRIWRSTK